MMSAQELAALPPLKPCDGKMLKIWKDDTPLRATLLKLSDITPALLRCEKALGDMSVGMYWYCETWAVWIRFNCNSEEEARKVTGKFWREFGKPKIEKPSDDTMEAHWLVDGLTIKVCGYKPKTCRYEEVQVLVPAKEREVKTMIIEAVEGI